MRAKAIPGLANGRSGRRIEMPVADAIANNSYGHVESILDAEMPEQVIWPDQVACGGFMWTRTFS
jgi:hypothetical protein